MDQLAMDQLAMDQLAKSDRPADPRIDPVVVLHIEDDRSVARAMARILRLQGYEVAGAVSSDEAIHLVVDGLVPDLILTDYHLPQDITGEQIVTEIETRLGFKPPTIMLASLPGPQVEKAKSVVDRIFAKPADMDEVLSEIGRLLGTLT
jgi:DNA-binding response OmpR family regulator